MASGAAGPQRPLNRAVIFLGPPGAGKGTQAKIFAGVYSVPHLSTGEMFRDHVNRGTKLGNRARPIMERGDLVPDEIVLGMVEERLSQADCREGFVFDGFPRTIQQAERLGQILNETILGRPLVIHFDVEHDRLFQRMSGRRTCKLCGEIYNIFDRPPKVPGRCDNDAGELVQRADDKEEVIAERLAAYDRQTRPLVDYYRAHGVLVHVNGADDPETVTRAILEILAQPQ